MRPWLHPRNNDLILEVVGEYMETPRIRGFIARYDGRIYDYTSVREDEDDVWDCLVDKFRCERDVLEGKKWTVVPVTITEDE